MRTARATALVVLLALAGCFQGPPREGSFQRTLAVSGRVMLYVDSPAGSITVHDGSAQSVSISARIRARGSFPGPSGEAKVQKIQANPPILQRGNEIHVGRIDDPTLQQHVIIDYEIIVPAHTQLDANTGAGNVTVTGLQEKVDARTGAGTIRIDDAAADVQLRSGAGNIDVRSPGAAVTAESGAGKISLSGEPRRDWRLKVGAGSLSVEVPADASFDLHAESGFGKVNLGEGLSLQDGSVSNSRVSGRIGRGGPRVELTNGAGAIEIRRGKSQN